MAANDRCTIGVAAGAGATGIAGGPGIVGVVAGASDAVRVAAEPGVKMGAVLGAAVAVPAARAAPRRIGSITRLTTGAEDGAA
jgi:hypothetical protein